jgi:hypothetical protein
MMTMIRKRRSLGTHSRRTTADGSTRRHPKRCGCGNPEAAAAAAADAGRCGCDRRHRNSRRSPQQSYAPSTLRSPLWALLRLLLRLLRVHPPSRPRSFRSFFLSFLAVWLTRGLMCA